MVLGRLVEYIIENSRVSQFQALDMDFHVMLVVASVTAIMAEITTPKYDGWNGISEWDEVCSLLHRFEQENQEFRNFVRSIEWSHSVLSQAQTALINKGHFREPKSRGNPTSVWMAYWLDLLKTVKNYQRCKKDFSRLSKNIGLATIAQSRIQLEHHTCEAGPSTSSMPSVPNIDYRLLQATFLELDRIRERLVNFFYTASLYCMPQQTGVDPPSQLEQVSLMAQRVPVEMHEMAHFVAESDDVIRRAHQLIQNCLKIIRAYGYQFDSDFG
ncbi:hypothetical protein QAD02_001709 [Eretmocerus hayati]|uniref:Uncharacterized protein n=1 Tax=Eretmocerus hayati TaxID=131215 RepID=A0ACC2NGV8_9HYME|nr:hypothetical protein QAD02_001709 [Eretmocerus hayati]